MRDKTKQVRRIAVAAGAVALSIGLAAGATAPPRQTGIPVGRIPAVTAYAAEASVPEGYAPNQIYSYFGAQSAVYLIEDTYYVNYEFGYVSCTAALDYRYFYGRNIAADGTAATVADIEGATDAQRNDVEASAALDALVVDTETVQAKFKAAYRSALTAGRYLGYSASGIFVHQGITVLQSFWHGEGTNGGNEEAYLVYNKSLDDAFAVTGFSAYWLALHGELGAPRGLEGSHTFKVNGEEITYDDCQMFDKGFVYRDENGALAHRTLDYDAANDNYGAMPENPDVVTLPDGYAVDWHGYGGNSGEIYRSGNVYYVNYDYGYVKCTDDGGALSYVYRYGYHADASGAETKTDFDALFAVQRRDLEPASDFTNIVADTATLADLFRAGYREAYDAGQIPGYTATGIRVWEGFAMQDCWRGAGNRIEADISRAYLVYNKTQDAVHAVTAFSDEWIALHSDLGAPVGIYGANGFKVQGAAVSYDECQMFEGGYAYRLNNETRIEFAAYDAEHNNYGEMPTVINPPDAWANYYGAQDSAYIVRGDVTYINYANGYVKCTETASGIVYDYYYGRNIDASGAVTLTDATRAADTMNFTVQAGVDLGGYVADPSTVPAVFRAAYIAAFAMGQVPGVTPAQIYIFNGVVIQNFWHGDGNANAMKEGYLTYHKATDSAYYVGKFASAWLGTATDLGAAFVEEGQHTFRVGGVSVTYDECQLFEGGYIYKQDSKVRVVTAFYDSANQSYIRMNVPSDFGALVGEPVLNGTETYYNFEHGAVKAIAGGDEIVYYNYPARTFRSDGTLVMQEIEYYLGLVRQANVVGFYTDEVKAQILDMVVAAYTEQFEAGFFPGFPDADIQMWDGIFGLQCFVGDSTANPFGAYDARTNVMTFSVDIKNQTVTVLKDEMLLLWSKLRIAPAFAVELGAPSGELQRDGANVYQQFGVNTLICVNGNIETWVVTSDPYEVWKAAQAQNNDADRGGNGNGYIGDMRTKGCASALTGGSALAGLGGLVAAALLIGKKKRGGKDA